MLARLVAARHMNAMPAIVATTPLPRPLRLNQRARLVPSAQFVRWYEIASATPGLGKLELAILAESVLAKYEGNSAVLQVLTRKPPRDCRLMKMEIAALLGRTAR